MATSENDNPEAQPGTNSIAGNSGAQPEAANTKMGIDVQNTNANNTAQPATTSVAAPSGDELTSGTQPATDPPTEGIAPAPTDPHQPDNYGGNFGNDVQPVFNDPNRPANQASNPNRGAFGEQGHLGNTHGGYGNQYREFNTAAERPAAEATEEKYYGQGASRPGEQHNSYRAYDGQDLAPDQPGQAVRDTQPVAAQHPGAGPAPAPGSQPAPADNRNLPGRDDQAAAFQNDNGSPTVGPAYAADYGHTSGGGLPAGTPSHHLPLGPDGHGLGTDPASARGGYDGQQREAESVSSPQGAPAPVNTPDAPQTEGYGYGHERSEQEQPGNPRTGDSRVGFEAGSSQEGDVSQGHGSKGGSYDDENPGARGPGHDQFTQQDKAQNYGQEQRDNFRPAEGDQPTEGDHGPTPRRNAGRD